MRKKTLELIYDALTANPGQNVTPAVIFDLLKARGISASTDPRFALSTAALTEHGLSSALTREQFSGMLAREQNFFSRVISDELIIPDFQVFSERVKHIYESAKRNRDGQVAVYIPQLARVNPEQFAVSVCTIDGQVLNLGDFEQRFCVQSVCKPINYCLALEEKGLDVVHQHVGHEPSGASFNAMTLNEEGLPHNPMINSGAIMTCSLIKADQPTADRFDYVLGTWQKACGSNQVGFNNSVYLSERETSDRNYALAYFMKEKGAFPPNTDLYKTLEFYFQCCSIETSARNMATFAAAMAGGGVCPFTGVKIFESSTVKNCLSLMNSCGMYDYSGQFAFEIGLPAKSGVSGGVMLVVPNTLGICLWSPRLDIHGNSVRGIDFCRQLVKTFLFHNYDSLVTDHEKKINPRLVDEQVSNRLVLELCFAAAHGDTRSIQNLLFRGANVNEGDYDRRTPLHLAVCEKQVEAVQYLLACGADSEVKDRWGQTPRSEAEQIGSQLILDLMVKGR